MLQNLKSTFRHSVIYSIGNISLKLIGLVLLPLYTSNLSLEEYGAFTLLEISAVVLVTIFNFRLATAMMRWCSTENSNKKRKSLIFSTYSFSVLIVILLNTAFYPFHGQLSTLFFNTSDFSDYFLILLASSAFEILNMFPLELLRLKEKSGTYAIVIIIRLTAILSLNYLFIVHYNLGIKGILLGQLLGHFSVYVVLLPFILRNMRFEFDFKELKSMLKYGLPLVFSSVAMMFLTMSDRYLIKHYLGYAEVGIYSLGYKIASVVNMFVIQSFQLGFLPIAYKMYDKPEAGRFFSKTLTYFVLIMVFVGLGVSLFAKELITTFAKNSDFFEAYRIVPIVVFAFLFKGIQYVYSLGLHYTKRTGHNIYIVLITAIINILLNILTIPHWGIYGAAVATLFSWAIMSVVFYFVSNKYYPVKYEHRKITILLLIFIAYSVLGYTIGFNSMLITLLIKFLLLLTIPFLLRLLNFYEEIELERIMGAWKKWKNLSNFKKNINSFKKNS